MTTANTNDLTAQIVSGMTGVGLPVEGDLQSNQLMLKEVDKILADPLLKIAFTQKLANELGLPLKVFAVIETTQK